MITIYSKKGCPHCENAIKISEIRGINFKVLKLGEDFTRDEYLTTITPKGHVTFPLVLDHAGEPIGGFDKYKDWLVAGGA